MAGMNVPVSLFGGGIVVMPLHEYEEQSKEHRNLVDKMAVADQLIKEMSEEIERRKQGRAAADIQLAEFRTAVFQVKNLAEEMLAGLASEVKEYYPAHPAEILRLCNNALEGLHGGEEGGAEC